MRGLSIHLDRDDGGYVPGEPVSGRVVWDLDQAPERIVVRLFWQTSGKGTRDEGVAEQIDWPVQSLRGEKAFTFAGIEGPYSFSGTLITVAWQVEATTQPRGAHTEQPLTLSPTGREVRP